MEKFKTEFEVGEIFRRDKWQFELKSEFFPSPKLKKNIYKQEFYFFIPNALQINSDTYSMKQFYQDQTNLIRYKTPIFTMDELLDPQNRLSPLVRIINANIDTCEDELKLLANIFRSLLRSRIGDILNKLKKHEEDIYPDVHTLCLDIKRFKAAFSGLEPQINAIQGKTPLHIHFYYTGEFISMTIKFYLTGLLEKVRNSSIKRSKEIDRELCHQIAQETTYTEKNESNEKLQAEEEYVFYRRSLLNKFILDALLLHTSRLMLYKRYSNFIGAIAAGIAMTIFFVFYVWGGTVFIINSIPFIMITVLLYIIKDRIKEGIKNVSYRHFHRLFPDYKTEIRSPDQKYPLGTMEESHSFIDESELPEEIIKIRHREFHAVLEAIKRPERVLYYKKTVSLLHPPKGIDIRRNALNIIFRFNISNFILKAENPTHEDLELDIKTGEIVKERLPKVYHLNIILKNTYIDENLKIKKEFKKFRLILDKNGIKRLEQLFST